MGTVVPDWVSDGSGDGSGYGYGSGYGDGYGDFWKQTIGCFARSWPQNQRRRLKELQKSGATIAFWRSGLNGLPVNGGGQVEQAAPGVVHKTDGPLNLCNQ